MTAEENRLIDIVLGLLDEETDDARPGEALPGSRVPECVTPARPSGKHQLN